VLNRIPVSVEWISTNRNLGLYFYGLRQSLIDSPSWKTKSASVSTW